MFSLLRIATQRRFPAIPWLGVSLFALLFLPGCETVEPGGPYRPSVQQTGTVSWTRAGSSGTERDARFSRDNAGRSSLSVGSEGAGLRLFQEEHMIQASGRLGGGTWVGSAGYATGALREWHSLLAAWVEASTRPGGSGEIRTPEYRAEFRKSGNRITSLQVRPNNSRATFSVSFPQPGANEN